MKNEIESVGWSEHQRLLRIERTLYWRGWGNRRDVRDVHGISAQQASGDLVTYQTLNPDACQYHTRRKRYEVREGMKPVLMEPDFGRDMHEANLLSHKEKNILLEPDLPARKVNEKILRQISLCVFAMDSIEIEYWSVSSGNSGWRRIHPRGFGFDGWRYHVRAFCELRGEFRDFVVGRISRVRNRIVSDKRDAIDAAWDAFVELELSPHEKLPEARKRASEMDFGMTNGVLKFQIRQAMEIYLRRRLGFPDEGSPVENTSKDLRLRKIGSGKKT